MKDLFSLFLLKKSMRKAIGINTFCGGNDSTSTLNHQYKTVDNHKINTKMFPANERSSSSGLTLEEMIYKLDIEEENERKAYMIINKYNTQPGRFSCVNNSDHILMSARNALNQYPRFSLDGKDAMYRSNFQNSDKKLDKSSQPRRIMQLPLTLGGEKVVWCTPGVVAKLMGLEAMPVPVNCSNYKQKIKKRHNFRRRASELADIDHEIKMRSSGG